MATKTTEIKIETLIPDNVNANKGTEYGQHLIEKSLREFGAGRSILIDKNNRIIAGNKTIENAAAIGLDKVIIVETTGDQIVAVKRTDIDLDSRRGRELALADNASAKANIQWDEGNIQQLESDWAIDPKDWGLNMDEINPDDFDDEFALKSGEKEPIQQMTFTLADQQVEELKAAIERVKAENNTDNMCGNQNKNGNALYIILKQWEEQRK